MDNGKKPASSDWTAVWQTECVGRRVEQRLLSLQHAEADLEAHGVCNHVGNVPNGHLVLLAYRQDDGVGLLVLAQHPDEEPRQVQVVDELAPAA